MTSDQSSNALSGTVLIRATQGESAGAGLHVGGLSVIERSLKQLAAQKLRIVLATDGSCPLPTPLPAAVETRTLASPQDMDRLRTELVDVPEVGADEVRPIGKDLKSSIRVTDRGSRKQAEDAVFAQLLRGDLGFVARYLNKPISFRITRYFLCHLPFTPNQVTVAAGVIGLLGAALVATGQRWGMILGFLLAHLQSVLDGCDGELARVRFQQSEIGEWLDTFVDEALNIALFAGIGIGLWQASGSELALVVGLAAAAGYVFYDVVALTELKRQGKGGEIIRISWRITGGINMKDHSSEKRGSLLTIVHTFGRRDFFIFAFLLCALAGVPFLTLVYASIIVVGLLLISGSQVAWHLFYRNRG